MTSTYPKPSFSIFISHIHEEAPIAKVLKTWLEACFPGHISAFVRSDNEDIPLGKKWLAEIEAAIDRSRLLIILISPAPFERMWIHLEAGWALGRKIEVLPICHSGRSVVQLPRPYGDWNGVDVDADDFAGRLLAALKTRLGLDHRLPEGMINALSEDIREVACNNRSCETRSQLGSLRGPPAEREGSKCELKPRTRAVNRRRRFPLWFPTQRRRVNRLRSGLSPSLGQVVVHAFADQTVLHGCCDRHNSLLVLSLQSRGSH